MRSCRQASLAPQPRALQSVPPHMSTSNTMKRSRPSVAAMARACRSLRASELHQRAAVASGRKRTAAPISGSPSALSSQDSPSPCSLSVYCSANTPCG